MIRPCRSAPGAPDGDERGESGEDDAQVCLGIANHATTARTAFARASGCAAAACAAHCAGSAHASRHAIAAISAIAAAADEFTAARAAVAAGAHHGGIRYALARHADLSGRTNGAHAIVDALTRRAELPCGAHHADARRFDATFDARITRLTVFTGQTGTLRNTSSIFAGLVVRALHARTRIDAFSDATNLAVRTNHIAARRFALPIDADFTRGARHVFACRIDAISGARTNQVGRALEFGSAALVDTGAFVANETGLAQVAFIGRTIAVVIEAITRFGLWHDRR